MPANDHLIERKSREIAAIREIARAISAALDLDSTLGLITRTTADVMRMDSCSIYLLDAAGEFLVLRATTGLAPEAVGKARLRSSQGLTGWAAAHRRPAASSDAQRDPRFALLPETNELDFRSLLAVPLLLGERVLGAVNVQTTAAHEFGDDDVELLSIIADLASGAIEKAQLYDSMRRQIQELTTLAEASQTLTGPMYLEEVLRVIARMAARLLRAQTCALLLVERGRLRVAAAEGADADLQAALEVALGEGVAGSVAARGAAAVIADVRDEAAFEARAAARERGLSSLLCVPLVVRDRVVGVLEAFTARARRFSDEERALLQTLANQTALAIENATLAVNAAVVREMHHRVKNNLQTIAMLLRLQMTDQPDAPSGPALAETVTRILSIAAVHEVLADQALERVDLREVLERVIAAARQMLPRGGVEIEIAVDEPVRLAARQATALALVVNELVQNAVEHGFAGRERGHVRVTVAREGAGVRVEVRDDGVGLPPGFDPDRGLGLRIVRALVRDDLGGTLAAERDGGTRLTVRVPRVEAE